MTDELLHETEIQPSAEHYKVIYGSEIIDQEFKDMIPPLSQSEYYKLGENIKTHGCLSPIILWNNIILDGHNRYEICKSNNIKFTTTKLSLKDRTDAIDWILNNQLGRRNLTRDAATLFLGMLYQSMVKKYGAPKRCKVMHQNGAEKRDLELPQNEGVPKSTAEIIADIPR